MDRLDKYRQVLTRTWGFDSFRPIQEEIIRSVDAGNDTVGLMPTGGGKSVTFQLPALVNDGICLVITPLISLMKDQVEKLRSMNIKALSIHSGMMREEISIALDNCIYGDYKLLYISPERIGSEIFRNRVGRMNVSLVAIDEAHCISQWGYDFRPSYLRIAELRDLIGKEIPFLALSATATPPVINDIMEKLKFRGKNLFRAGFDRDNLIYLVRKIEDKNNYLLSTIRKVNGSGIIYVRSRKKTREIADYLVTNGISADFYHAGLKREVRDTKQEAWSSGACRIIVATNAFGMGIDKPDVRFVLHWDLPDSIESYFQESGRAGRDGIKAWAVQIYNDSDIKRVKERTKKAFPPIERIKDIYDLLCNFLQIPVGSGKFNTYDFSLANFVSAYRLQVTEAYNALKFLEREGYFEITDELNNPSRVMFTVGRDDLYRFQVANANLDNFIKLLLRSYTGMFSEFVAVDEEMLSKRSGLTRDEVYDYLVKLRAQNLIKYIPGKKSALIIFTEERLDRKGLLITPENYHLVKKRYKERLEKIIKYVTSTTRCRVTMLLEYFGEEVKRCGQCDVCQTRNEVDLSQYEFDLILDKIKEVLHDSLLETDELVEKVEGDKEKTIRVIRWLLDHDKIILDDEGRMTWNR